MSSCEKKLNGYVNLKRTVGYQSTKIGKFACYILACLSSCLITECRVPTRPGKPGKMRVHLENLEISWNFEKFNKYHGKMT